MYTKQECLEVKEYSRNSSGVKEFLLFLSFTLIFSPDDSDGKESTFYAGDLDSIPVFRRSPGRGHGNPLQYSCLENPHGQRGYSPSSHKESDMTERLSTTFIIYSWEMTEKD